MTEPATRHPITGPSAWRGQDLAGTGDWITSLPEGAAHEIDAALSGVAGQRWQDITRDTFPLPTVSKTLDDLAHELEHGRGFVRLRGLPVDCYDEDDLRKILWGIGCHLGTARYQNAQGELIGEVRDELRAFGAVRESHQSGVDGKPVSSRYKTRTSGPLRFHTDRCDVIALLCARASKSGGVSRLVSAVAVHNEILARRPDLLELLYGDYHRSRIGMATCGIQGWFNRDQLTVRAAWPGGVNDPDAFGVMAVGLSLLPAGIEPGFLCLCAPSASLDPGDLVFIERGDDHVTIKQYAGQGAKGRGWLRLVGWLDPESDGRQNPTPTRPPEHISSAWPPSYTSSASSRGIAHDTSFICHPDRLFLFYFCCPGHSRRFRRLLRHGARPQ